MTLATMLKLLMAAALSVQPEITLADTEDAVRTRLKNQFSDAEKLAAARFEQCAYSAAMDFLSFGFAAKRARGAIEDSCVSSMREYSALAQRRGSKIEVCGTEECIDLNDAPPVDMRYGAILLDGVMVRYSQALARMRVR